MPMMPMPFEGGMNLWDRLRRAGKPMQPMPFEGNMPGRGPVPVKPMPGGPQPVPVPIQGQPMPQQPPMNIHALLQLLRQQQGGGMRFGGQVRPY